MNRRIDQCIIYKRRKDEEKNMNGCEVKKPFPENTFVHNRKDVQSALTFFRDFDYNIQQRKEGAVLTQKKFGKGK